MKEKDHIQASLHDAAATQVLWGNTLNDFNVVEKRLGSGKHLMTLVNLLKRASDGRQGRGTIDFLAMVVL
jgi:hypothetical protein